MNNAGAMIIVLDIEVIKMENTLTEEQIKKIMEQLIEIIKPIVKSILEIYKKIKEMLIKNWLKLKSFIEKGDRVNKYIKIYKKTKNRRIQKKQVAKIVKMLQKYKK